MFSKIEKEISTETDKNIIEQIIKKYRPSSDSFSSEMQRKYLHNSRVSEVIIEENMSIDEIIEDIKRSPKAITLKKGRSLNLKSELAQKINIALNGNPEQTNPQSSIADKKPINFDIYLFEEYIKKYLREYKNSKIYSKDNPIVTLKRPEIINIVKKSFAAYIPSDISGLDDFIAELKKEKIQNIVIRTRSSKVPGTNRTYTKDHSNDIAQKLLVICLNTIRTNPTLEYKIFDSKIENLKVRREKKKGMFFVRKNQKSKNSTPKSLKKA